MTGKRKSSVNEEEEESSSSRHPLIQEYDGHKKEKLRMIYNLLDEIKTRKEKHYSRYSSYKKTNALYKAVINTLNSVSVCSLVLTFTQINEIINIVALCSSTTATFITASVSAFELESKVYSHQTSYLQYQDMHRDLSAKLYKNGLSSKDMDAVLTDLNARMGLIEDNSLPIGMSSIKVNK